MSSSQGDERESQRQTKRKTLNQMRLKRSLLPTTSLKQILDFSGIPNQINRGKLSITRSNRQHIVSRTLLPLKFWLLMSISFIVNQGTGFQMELEADIPFIIRVLVQQTQENTRIITLSAENRYNRLFLSKQFVDIGKSCMVKKNYPFLKVMYEILSSYGFSYYRFHESLVFRLLSYQRGDQNIIKDLLLRKPNLEKIQATILSKEDEQFLNILKQLYPPTPEGGAFEDVLSLTDLIGRLDPVYDQDG